MPAVSSREMGCVLMLTYLKALREMAYDELRRSNSENYARLYRRCDNIMKVRAEYERLIAEMWLIEKETKQHEPPFVKQFNGFAEYGTEQLPCVYCGAFIAREPEYFTCPECGAMLEVHEKPSHKLYDKERIVYYWTPGKPTDPFWAIVRGEE